MTDAPLPVARWRAVAFGWGFAEATLFFVVPDVWITRVALRSGREAAWAIACAVLGAVLGGAAIVAWARNDPAGLRAALDAVPAVAPALIDRVGVDWSRLGALAPLLGGFSGVPYKLYAAHAPQHLQVAPFLALTAAVRGVRFAAVAAIAWALARCATPRWGPRAVVAAWALAWTALYAVYWSTMPN